MVGTEISHYKIVEQIGSGGIGVVYKAVDLRLDRLVALKFLSPFLTTDAESRERFIQEAKAASALQHNNICTIHDIDHTSDGRMFIVMDCYAGTTLKKRIEQGPITPEETVSIASQIASGLSRAHEHGIIHRDIKPENIFVTSDGVVKILDFGLAKLSGQSLTHTNGTTRGTVAYLSPDQIEGKEADPSSDIWSFGVVLYEMLTGRLPFPGRLAPAVMYAILHEDPTDVLSLEPDIPPGLAAVCMDCLNKDGQKRPPSMATILFVLEGNPQGHHPKAEGRWKLLLGASVISFIAIVIVYWPRSAVEPSQSAQATLAVLQFRNLTRDSATADWPEVVQALMVSCLTGVEGLRVYDPVGLNTVDNVPGGAAERSALVRGRSNLPPVTFTVDGSIIREENHFVLHISIRDRISQEIISSNLCMIHSDVELSRIADSLSLVCVEVLQAHSALPSYPHHLQPWWPKEFRSIYAMKAFSQACQLALAGDPDHSEKALRQAIALDPSFVTPRVWLVTRLVSRGDSAEAALHFKTLLMERDSGGPFDKAVIAWAQACLNRNISAQINALEQALEYSPGNAILLYSLGRAEYLGQNYRECTAVLQPVADRKWEYPSLYLLLAQAYDMLEEYGMERTVLDAALAMRRPPPEAHSLLATLLRRTGSLAAALREDDLFVEMMTQRGEPLRVIYASLSNLNITEGFLKEGVTYYRLALRNSKEPESSHTEDAESLCARGDTLNAVVEFLRAIAADSTNASAHFRLAQILEALKEPQKAIEYYRMSIALDSASPRAIYARSHLANLQQ